MNNQQTPEKTVMDEVIESLIKKTEVLEKELSVKQDALLAKEEQTQGLITAFETKFGNVVIQAPEPDLSKVNTVLKNGLALINQTMEKWPKPLTKAYRFTLFPEQIRSVEYVKAVLTRIILLILILVFMGLTYLLLNDHLK
ncbi:hypothetical protein [Pedobacter sp. MR22-3]|uniref:hypothetical protein n=1 Tax=Pedobacter sp. MR22-3 TaxID=2994552 RepID=UPI002247A7DB|nr:hypothetical protein [Pedobacter sp. MR22-3]MCX2585940.1 hypothetical protein [Pedobacter sp. MR22-3]